MFKIFFLQCFVLSWEYFNSVICLEKCDFSLTLIKCPMALFILKIIYLIFWLCLVFSGALGFLQLQRAGAAL